MRFTSFPILLAFVLASLPSRADPLPTSAEHVPTPGRSVAGEDTSQALVLNPANLAYLPAADLRWTWVRCPDDARKVGCGHAWEAATPLFFDLSTAVRVDLVQPPGVGFPYGGFDYVWFTWGLAAKLSDRVSIGASLERAYSQNGYIDGLFGLTAGATWRPSTHFGFAAVAHDFNRPSTQFVPQQGSLPVLDARYALAMALRPTGRRNVEAGLELDYWQGSDQWTDRGTLSFDVPGFGRAYAGVEVAHIPNDSRRGIVGTAGLELRFGGLGVGGGALFGDGLGSNGTVAEYASVAVSGYTQPGIPHPARAVWLRIEHTPSTRGHVALLRRLWRIAEERDTEAVTLVMRAEPAGSFAHAEELADAIRVLRAHGKRVLCSWEDAGPRAVYACASANRIVVSPAGGVHYAGLKSQYVYLKGLLDKIGVRGQFIRIGPHKSAPEQFTNEHAGPVAAADHEDMLRQQEAVFLRNLALYRQGMDEHHVRAVTAKGPFVAGEAREAGWVDGFAFDDEIERATKELVGHDLPYVKYEDVTPAPDAFGPRGKVAVLYLDGDIVDGRSRAIPLLDERLVGSYSMQETIGQLRDDANVRAVVLRVESPGGSSLASDVMWRELVLLGSKKPLVVSMGTVAASGGYYVASASKNVFALPLTVTGSIGVFYGKADASGLLDKLGITVDTYKTAPRADAESAFRPFSPDEEKELEHKVHQFYETFLDRIHRGRGMPVEEIDAVGRGRVWTGQQAFEHHLVDHLGGLRHALEAARAAAGLPDDAPVAEYPPEHGTLLERALAAAAGGDDPRTMAAAQLLPPPVRDVARAVAPLMIYRADEPLARLEWVDVGQW